MLAAGSNRPITASQPEPNLDEIHGYVFFFNAEAYYEMAYKICYFLTPHSFLSRSLVVYPSLPWLGRRAEAPHPAMELIWVPKNTSLQRKAIGNF